MRRRTTLIGIFLIIFGLLTFLGNFGINADWLVLPLISLGFLFVYFICGAWKRKGNLGFLIPGVITGVIGFYVILDESGLIPPEADPIFLVMLGAGFIMIMFIHTLRIGNSSWGEKYWPVFPGGILVMVGALALTTSVSKTVYSMITPVILVAIGIYLLISQMRGQKTDGHLKGIHPNDGPGVGINLRKKTDGKDK